MRAVTAILLFVSGVTAGAETAGTVFINGNIYTVNDKQPFAQAIAVKCDRIIFVGANADAEKLRTASSSESKVSNTVRSFVMDKRSVIRFVRLSSFRLPLCRLTVV